MGIVALTAAFLLSAPAALGEYIYVEDRMTWLSAQKYCRDNYVDLTPVMTERKGQKLLSGKIPGALWTSLYCDRNQWKWSGGSKAMNVEWAAGQPDNTFEECGSVCWWQCQPDMTGLHNVQCTQPLPFLCLNLIVPQHRGTWEQALSSCRNMRTELMSLSSETNHLLALTKVQKGLSERVWIGLRFLADQWVWIDGRKLPFQAWSQEDQEHRCPVMNRCGTLTKGGLWESWDCTDRLHFLCR